MHDQLLADGTVSDARAFVTPPLPSLADLNRVHSKAYLRRLDSPLEVAKILEVGVSQRRAFLWHCTMVAALNDGQPKGCGGVWRVWHTFLRHWTVVGRSRCRADDTGGGR